MISIFNLRECQPEDILSASERAGKMEVATQRDGLYSTAFVASGERVYQVDILTETTWASCECDHFKITHQCCKHIAFAMKHLDERSFNRICDQERVGQRQNRIKNAVLAPVERTQERIGSIPI